MKSGINLLPLLATSCAASLSFPTVRTNQNQHPNLNSQARDSYIQIYIHTLRRSVSVPLPSLSLSLLWSYSSAPLSCLVGFVIIVFVNNMVRFSNNLIGILNFLTLVLSIPILVTGVWLSKQADTDCERWLERPIIVLGVCLLLVSLAGLIGACCRVSWLLWLYLLVMFLLIVLVFAFTIFAFVVTNKGAGEALSGKGYKEYKLGDYSNWLQKRVNNTHTWNRIQSCLQSGKLCQKFESKFLNDTVQQFYTENLSELQSGCCKPSNDCNFTYQGPTTWNSSEGASFSNPDCKAWNNDPSILCFNCQSCKAGFLQNLKTDWKKVAVVNIIFLIFLIIVYSIGCCAFRNNRADNWKRY